MTLLLALDTALGGCSAALVADGDGGARVLSHRFEARAKGHAERLVPMVSEVLAEASVTFGDIDRLGVTVGPGTFTGLRVGVSAVRGLRLATGCPVVPVNTLDAIRANLAADEATRGETVAIAIDARRNEIYLQLFDAEDGALTGPMLAALDDLAALVPEGPVLAAGTGAALLAENLGPEHVARVSPASPQPDAAKFGLVLLGREASTEPPAPLYLRRPDAKLPSRMGVERR